MPAQRASVFLVTVVIALAVPFAWRAVGTTTTDAPSYLPALERSRPRIAFDQEVVAGVRQIDPQWVVIGDSMAGRVDVDRLHEMTREGVAPILRNATGSAYWFLAFKNFILPAGVRPKWTLIFFRDTNLTELMFRIDGPYRASLDEAAHAREPELNDLVSQWVTGPWYRVHRLVDDVYGAERARAAIEPRITSWPARALAGGAAPDLLDHVNRSFGLDHLRQMPQADLDAAEGRETDFQRNVGRSILPVLLARARERGLRLCFIRVLRRPVDGAAPPQSPALARYVADLRAYLTAAGAVFLDDRDDPRMASIAYEDGDHIQRGETRRYTEMLVERLQAVGR